MQDDDQGDMDDDPCFLPQPATPDLVKTTRLSQEKESNGSWNSSPEERPRRRTKRDQRRSYTTSIIINPGSERTFVSVGAQKQSGDKSPGDVTLDIAKVFGHMTSQTNSIQCQIFVDGHSNSRITRRQSHKDYTSSSSSRRSLSDEQILSLPSAGDLFPGTDHDVSYV